MGLPTILYDNRFNDGTPAATDEESGFSVLNITDLRPYTFWKAASTGTKTIQVACGAVKSADCIGIIGHNLNSVGAAIFVEYSTDNVNWTEAWSDTPTSDKTYYKEFTPPGGFWYWRLRITGATTAPKIAVLVIGNKLAFPYPADTPYTPYSEKIEADTAMGKTGHPLGAVIRYKPREIQARFSNLARTFVLGPYKQFWDDHASDLKPFFYAEDLDTFPDHTFYVQVSKGSVFRTPLSVSTLVDSISLNMEGVKE